MHGLCTEAKKIWGLYAKAETISDIEELISMMCDDIVIIGTGEHEVYCGKQAFLAKFTQELEQRKDLYLDLLDLTCEEAKIGDKSGLVYGVLYIRIVGQSMDYVVDMNCRYSMLFRLEHEKWKIAHVHQSLPEATQEDNEFYPKALAEKYVQNSKKAELLERQVALNNALHDALIEHNADTSIEVFLERLCKYTNGERMYIFEEREKGYLDNTYEWCAQGVTPQKQNLQKVPLEVVQIWYDYFDRKENVIIEDLEAIREDNPVVYEYLKPQEITSLAACPIIMQNSIIGFFGIDNPPKSSLEDVSNLLLTIGHFIVATLQKRELMNELTHMSYHDQLTGARNRHALEMYCKEISKSDSLGIIFCDVTGLKEVNDKQGHEAGDALLHHACESVWAVFEPKHFFRMGGDEFLVVYPQVGELEFLDKVEQMKEAMLERNVVLAIGVSWVAENNREIEELIRLAESKMYENKREYYRKSRRDRRSR